jgi:hypothetical protein
MNGEKRVMLSPFQSNKKRPTSHGVERFFCTFAFEKMNIFRCGIFTHFS